MQENTGVEFGTMCRVDTVNNFTYEVSAVKIMEYLLGDSENAVLKAIEIPTSVMWQKDGIIQKKLRVWTS